MARRANPALIGGFVVGAIVLATAGLAVLGGGHFFRMTRPVVAYFEGTVKGVAVGAPVTFQGVKVGTVTDVRVVIEPRELRISTPVFFEIDASRLTADGAAIRMPKDDGEGLRTLIQRGLRAELELQSFVTGQVGIGLAFRPDTPARLTGLSPGHLEMPTVASSMEKLTRTFETLPLEEIAVAAKETLQGIQALVQAPETRATLRSLKTAVERSEATLRAIQTLAQHVDGQLDPLMTQVHTTARATRGVLGEAEATLGRLAPRVDDALHDYQTLARNTDVRLGRLSAALERTMASLDRTLGGADDVLGDGSEVRVGLVSALDELAETAQSIRAFVEYLERNPNALVFGKGRASP